MSSEAPQPLWERDPAAWAALQRQVAAIEAEEEAKAIIDRTFPARPKKR